MTAHGVLLGQLLSLSAKLQECSMAARYCGDAELVLALRDSAWKVTAAIARLSRVPGIEVAP